MGLPFEGEAETAIQRGMFSGDIMRAGCGRDPGIALNVRNDPVERLLSASAYVSVGSEADRWLAGVSAEKLALAPLQQADALVGSAYRVIDLILSTSARILAPRSTVSVMQDEHPITSVSATTTAPVP